MDIQDTHTHTMTNSSAQMPHKTWRGLAIQTWLKHRVSKEQHFDRKRVSQSHSKAKQGKAKQSKKTETPPAPTGTLRTTTSKVIRSYTQALRRVETRKEKPGEKKTGIRKEKVTNMDT